MLVTGGLLLQVRIRDASPFAIPHEDLRCRDGGLHPAHGDESL